MVAIRERLEAIPVCSVHRLGEHRQSSQYRARVAGHKTERPAVLRVTDALQVELKPGREVPLSADQSAPSRSWSVRLKPAAKLRLATRRVLAALARIAFADIGDVFDDRGEVIPFAHLPPGIRSAIAEYRVRHYRNGTLSVSVKLHPKLPALVALGRHLGVFGRCSENGVSQAIWTTHRPFAPRSTPPDTGMGL